MWVKRMKAKLADDHPDYPELSAEHVLGNCKDFREEIGAMQELVQSHGNIVQFRQRGTQILRALASSSTGVCRRRTSGTTIITSLKTVRMMSDHCWPRSRFKSPRKLLGKQDLTCEHTWMILADPTCSSRSLSRSTSSIKAYCTRKMPGLKGS